MGVQRVDVENEILYLSQKRLQASLSIVKLARFLQEG